MTPRKGASLLNLLVFKQALLIESRAPHTPHSKAVILANWVCLRSSLTISHSEAIHSGGNFEMPPRVWKGRQTVNASSRKRDTRGRCQGSQGSI